MHRLLMQAMCTVYTVVNTFNGCTLRKQKIDLVYRAQLILVKASKREEKLRKILSWNFHSKILQCISPAQTTT